MKTKLKKVYYCDFCNKHNMSSFAIQKHEDHCTSNIFRTCRMCKSIPDYSGIIDELKKRFEIIKEHSQNKTKWIGSPVTIAEIENIADGCPACILTILKLSGLFQTGLWYDFDYEERSREYLKEKYSEENNPFD